MCNSSCRMSASQEKKFQAHAPMGITQNFLAYFSFYFTRLLFFPFFKIWMLHMENTLCVYYYFLLKLPERCSKTIHQKQRNVFTCYGFLKRTKEKTNIENNEKILLAFIITIVLCIVLMSLLLITDVPSSLVFIW